MGRDGSDRTVVVDDLGNDAWPEWSPDGDWIAFTGDRDGGTDIFVVRPDGSDLTRVTTDLGGARPRWLPSVIP